MLFKIIHEAVAMICSCILLKAGKIEIYLYILMAHLLPHEYICIPFAFFKMNGENTLLKGYVESVR